tara:strand:- start:395 stop:802 length:408 start_codon:yes stop_codon:yes gene_type:complete
MKKYKALILLSLFFNTVTALSGHNKIISKEFIRYVDSVIEYLELTGANKKDLEFFKKCKSNSTKSKSFRKNSDMLSLRYCNSYYKKGLYKKDLMDLKLPNESNQKFINNKILIDNKEKEFEEKKIIKQKTNLLFY